MLNKKASEIYQDHKLKSKQKGMPIKIGDKIFLQSISIDKVIMMGEGIANKKIQCVQTVTKDSNNSVNQFRKCIFQLKKANQFWYKNILDVQQQKSKPQQDNRKDQETLEFLQYKAKEEEDDNNDYYGKNNDTLVYGADIQLQHIYSNCIITLNEDKLAKQSGCLLLDQNSSYSNFKVKPLNNLYSLGDVVRYGDTISLQSCQNKQFFVHLNQENKQLYKPMEVNASEAMSYFKIKCYSNLVDDQDQIQDYIGQFDIISLHQASRILTVTQPDLKSSFVQKHCVTKEDTGLTIEYNQYSIGYFDQEKFFQHENEIYCLDITDDKKDEIKIKSNPFSFWEIQPEQQFTQDLCTRDRFYRLKNLGTNMYLYAENQEVKLTNNYWNPNTLFQIQPTEEQDKNSPISYQSKQLQIYNKNKMILTQFFDYKKNLNTIGFYSKDNKKNDLSSMIFQIKRADIQYIQILDKISSINPSLIQFHQFLQNFGMIPYQSNKKKQKSLNITEYDYQQTIKDEKDIQYESQNLIETIESLKFTVNSAIQNENSLIKIKDLQNITLEQTTLDLLIFILELTNQFMLKPPTINRGQILLQLSDDKDATQNSQCKKQLWSKIQSKIKASVVSENTKKIIKKIQNKTPFKVANKYLQNIYVELINLLSILLYNNRKSSEHFLHVADEFLFEKCKEKCEYSIKLMKIAFISCNQLRKNKDLEGENLQNWLKKLEEIRDDNIFIQNLLLQLIYYSFLYKQSVNSIYQNKFLKEIFVVGENNIQTSKLKNGIGLGYFSIINQNAAFQFNAQSNFVKQNNEIEKAINQKRLRNYSNSEQQVYLLKDINALKNNQNDYSEHITNNLQLWASLCKGQNKKAQKLILKIGINSQFLITLLEDKTQKMETRIPIMEIYQNLFLNIGNQTYVKSFENKTIIWENKQTANGGNMMAPICSIFHNFESNISESLSQGFIIDLISDFWNKDQSEVFLPKEFDINNLGNTQNISDSKIYIKISYFLQHINQTKFLIDRGFCNRQFNSQVLKGIIHIFGFYYQFVEQREISFHKSYWIYKFIYYIYNYNHHPKQKEDFNTNVNQILFICMEILQLLQKIQLIILSQNIIQILQELSQTSDGQKTIRNLKHENSNAFKNLKIKVQKVFDDFKDDQIEQHIDDLQKNNNAEQNKATEILNKINIFSLATKGLNQLSQGLLGESDNQMKLNDENNYILSIVLMNSIMAKDSKVILFQKTRKLILEQIISIFNQRQQICQRIQQYDGLEELEIYREFYGATSYNLKISKAIGKLKKYQSNEMIKKLKQNKMETMINSLTSAIVDLNERFQMRKNDPQSQAKMQRMIKNFKIHQQVAQIIRLKIRKQNEQTQVNYSKDVSNTTGNASARLLLYYVKGNEPGQKDLIEYLKTFMDNIQIVGISRLIFEIMSCFYKEPEIADYIDHLNNILLKHGHHDYIKQKIIKLYRALTIDKLGVPIFKNQQQILNFIMKSKPACFLFENNSLHKIYEKKFQIQWKVFTPDQIYAHLSYYEYMITISNKNRMGLLNITKQLTYDNIKNLLCSRQTIFTIKATLLKCVFQGFINDYQKNNSKSISQICIYIETLLKKVIDYDLGIYKTYLQGLINMTDKSKFGNKKYYNSRIQIAANNQQSVYFFDAAKDSTDSEFNNKTQSQTKPTGIQNGMHEYWEYYDSGKSWDKSRHGMLNFIFDCVFILKKININDDIINETLYKILEKLNRIRTILVKMNIEYELSINNLLFKMYYTEVEVDRYLQKCQQIKNQERKKTMNADEQELVEQEEQDNTPQQDELLEILLLIINHQQIRLKDINDVFQRGEVYIEKLRFIEKLVQYLNPVINSIDNFPYNFNAQLIKSFLNSRNLISNNKYVDITNFFKQIQDELNYKFLPNKNEEEEVEQLRTDRFLKKIEINQQIKVFINFFEKIQSDNLQQEINCFANVYLYQIIATNSDKNIKEKKQQLRNNLKVLIEIFQSNQIHSQFILDILIIFLNQIEQYQVQLDKQWKEENQDTDLNPTEKIEILNEVQIILDDAGAIKYALTQLDNFCSKEKLKSSLLCLIKMSSGNLDIQQRIYNRVTQTQEQSNNFSRSLFNIFTQILQQDNQDNMTIQQKKISLEQTAQISQHIFEFLYILCQNCFQEFQDFLRGPNSNQDQESLNVIIQTSNFIRSLKCEYLGNDVILFNEIRKSAIRSLMNYCLGPNQKNQIILCIEKGLINYLNEEILQIDINFTSSDPFQIQLVNLFQETILFILSIVSENFNKKAIQILVNEIDFNQLINKMYDIYKFLVKNRYQYVVSENFCYHDICQGKYQCYKNQMKDKEYDIIQTGFNIFIILDLLLNLKCENSTLMEIQLNNTTKQNQKKIDAIMQHENNLKTKFPKYFSDKIDIKKSKVLKKISHFQMLQDLQQQSKDALLLIKQKAQMDNQNDDDFDNEDDDFNNDNLKQDDQDNYQIVNLTNYWFKDDPSFQEYIKLTSVKKFLKCKKFFKELIGNVELSLDDQIIKVYFQKPLKSLYLSEIIKYDLICCSNRETNQKTLQYLMSQSGYYELQMKFHQAISRNPILNYIRQVEILKLVCQFCILIICYMQLVYAYHEATPNPIKDYYTDEKINFIVDNKLKWKWDLLPQQERDQIYDFNVAIKNIHFIIILAYTFLFMINKLPRAINLEQKFQLNFNYFKQIFIKLIDAQNMYNIFYLLLSILAFFQEFVYSAMIADIFKENPVFKTLKQEYQILLKTLYLGLVIIYEFSVFQFVNLHGTNIESPGSAIWAYDYSLLTATSGLLNYGLRMSTNFITFFNKNKDEFLLQTFWSILFYLIVNQILMNIIFGLIISGFGKNREQQKLEKLDIEQKCFICGLKKYEFDMKGSGWQYHIYCEHNVYQYVFYILYIKNKRLEKCNLLEKIVKNDLKKNQPSFFPIGKALCLQKQNVEDNQAQDQNKDDNQEEKDE